MRFYKFIILLPLLGWGFDSMAQAPQGGQGPSSISEQWQLTVDVMKSKMQRLMTENNGLQAENLQLLRQTQQLQQSIAERQPYGWTDQKTSLEALKQGIKTKRQRLKALDGQLRSLNKKKSDLEHQIKLLNNTISKGKIPHAQEKDEAVPMDDQLTQWRGQLENENKKEALLAYEVQELKASGKTAQVNGDVLDLENKELEAKLDQLRLQKLQHESKPTDTELAKANQHRYEELKKRKDLLESDIDTYEMRLNDLRKSSLMALSWPLKKKALVHEIVQTDAYNNEMSSRINQLHEDIKVLSDEVSKLEHQVKHVQVNNAQQ